MVLKIETVKRELQLLKKELKTAEEERMNCNSQFRQAEKLNGWDADMYLQVKSARRKFSSIYMKILSYETKLKELEHEL